jgi:hypothetical protein
MDPKYDETDTDLEATVRNMRALSSVPGDLSVRQSIAGGFVTVNDRLGKIDVRLARIDERQINRTTVAEICRTEMASLKRDVEFLNRMVWGIAASVGTALVGLLFFKIFGH